MKLRYAPVPLPLWFPWWLLPLLALVGMETAAFFHDEAHVAGNTLHDYDTLTRLAYLRDVMARGSWDHGYFSRINAPYGMHLHWTLPFNLILLGLVKAFALVNKGTALQSAGYWTGPIFRVLIGPVAYWAGRELLTPVASAFASAMIVFSPYLLDYSRRGSANHHVLLVLDAIVLAGLAVRLANRPGANRWLPLALGAMAAFSLWTTFELVILVGPLLLIVFVTWIAIGEARLRQLLLVCAGFSVTLSLALAVDPPLGGVGAVLFDHVSAPFQSLGALPLVMALAAAYVRPPNSFKRFRFFAATGFGVSAAWLMCYPGAFGGVQGAMDPYVAREWLQQIEEVQPIHDWKAVAALLGPGLICLVLIFNWRNRLFRDAVLIGIGFLYILAQLHFRFAGYLAIAAAYYLGYVFDQARLATGEFPARFSRFPRTAAAALAGGFFALQVAMVVFHLPMLEEADNRKNKDDIPDFVTCSPYTVRALLDDRKFLHTDKPHPIFVNEVNDAGMLVYWTGVDTLAGNYHRDSRGIKDDYLFFRDLGDENARNIVARRGIDYVLVCGNGNNVLYSYVTVEKASKEMEKPGEEFEPQNTMYTRLTDGKPPPWLVPVDWPGDVDTDLLLYRVDKTRLDAPDPALEPPGDPAP